MKSDKFVGNMTMIVVSILFGVNFPATKLILANGYMDPFGLLVSRMLVGTAAFWISSLFVKKEKVEKGDAKWIVLAGILGLVLNQGAFVVGINHTSPIDSSVLTTLLPIITIFISYIAFREVISKRKIPGLLLGITGALSLVYFTHAGFSGEGSSLLGNIIILSGVTSYSCFLVFGKRVSIKYSPVTMMKWMFLTSTIIVLPFFYKHLLEAPIWTREFSWEGAGSLIYIVIGATYLPYLLLPIAQKRIPPTNLSMFNYIMPVVATILGVILGQAELTIFTLLSAGLIFSGVFLVVRSR